MEKGGIVKEIRDLPTRGDLAVRFEAVAPGISWFETCALKRLALVPTSR